MYVGKPIQYTKDQYQQIMDYDATYLQVYIYYYTIDMVLIVDSDAAYLVMP